MQNDTPQANLSELDDLLREAVSRGATDIHARAGDLVRARVDGALVPIGARILSSNDLQQFAERLLSSAPVPTPALADLRDFKFPWGASGIGRFRVSILRQRSSFMVVLRVIPFDAPSFADLGLPPAIADALSETAGLVLVSGHAKSGRTSTLASMVHHMNTTSVARRHIVMIERATRLLQRDQKCSITQREVGVDVETVESGLQAAIDQDADVIVLGELPSLDLLEQALETAETGRLVIVRLDSDDVVGTFRDLLDRAQDRQGASRRLRLARAIKLIVSQRLLPRADGRGRALVAEIYRSAPALESLILDAGSFLDLRHALAAHRDELGTQTFDQHLADLVVEGTIALDVAMDAADDPLALRQVSNEAPARVRAIGR
jgi:twitching motility protein PilT